MDEIPADLLPEDVEKELEMELLPNTLNRDVTALAGELNFKISEISYISGKDTPFKFMLDQWCKREGKNATLNSLKESLLEIKRQDLAEVVENTIQKLRDANFDQLLTLNKLQHRRVDRRNEDCTFVSTAIDDTNKEHGACDEKPVNVYAIYYAENEEYVENVHECLNFLRSEYGIDAYSNITDKNYDCSKPFTIFNNIRKADYVLVFCSQSFRMVKEFESEDDIPELYKEIMFALNFIFKDIFFKRGTNRKFLPVLVKPSTKGDIPRKLIATEHYQVPKDYELLARAIYDIPMVQLPPMGTKPKKSFTPRLVKRDLKK